MKSADEYFMRTALRSQRCHWWSYSLPAQSLRPILYALANAWDFNLLTLGHSIAHKPFVASSSNAVLAGYGSAYFKWTLFSPGPTITASFLLNTPLKTERVCVMVSFNHNNYPLLSAFSLSTLLH